MNDPFRSGTQPLTDALLQLDRSISLAETNVVAAQQLGLPEAADMAARLPGLTLSARQFLANVPDMTQPQRWGEARRLLDQARAFQPYFAPYMALGNRVSLVRQQAAEQAARSRAAADAARRIQHEHEAQSAMDTARKRQSMLRQTYADMQMQRGPGYDDPSWQDGLRSVGSILTAQDVRLSAAASSLRESNFDQAQAQLDQALGELQAGLDLAQRARVAAGQRAQRAAAEAASTTVHMPNIGAQGYVIPSDSAGSQASVTAPSLQFATLQSAQATTLTMIEARTGTVFRCDGRPTVVGRGLDAPTGADPYLNLSRACDPGEAESLGISRRHAEIQRQPPGFMVRDLGSTNGTRLRHAGQPQWETLTPQRWVVLKEGDVLQFGLLECAVALS